MYHMFYCKIASNVDDNKQERGQCHKYMQIDLIEQRRKKYISKRQTIYNQHWSILSLAPSYSGR